MNSNFKKDCFFSAFFKNSIFNNSSVFRNVRKFVYEFFQNVSLALNLQDGGQSNALYLRNQVAFKLDS